MDPELKSRLDALIASMAERESREKAKESRETRERAARGENIRISGLEPAQFEAVEQQVKNVRDYLFQISGEKNKQLNLVSQEEDSFKRRVEYLKVHEQYALVISSNAGLWRYLIGDTIKFTSIQSL